MKDFKFIPGTKIQIKNEEGEHLFDENGKFIGFCTFNSPFIYTFYHQIYHEVIIEKIKKLYFNAIQVLQIKDDEIGNKLSNLKTYHTHSFRTYYYHLLSLYAKDLNMKQARLGNIDFKVEELEELYFRTSFYRFDKYSKQFSTNAQDYDIHIWYNRLFQGVMIHRFLNISFDALFERFPNTVKDMAELLVFYDDRNRLTDIRVREIDEKIIGCLDYIFEDKFYHYNNEDNSKIINIFKTLNQYTKFEYIKNI